ncbi:MAG: DUF397 domain-containing protein, partial [Actinomycetes bacterium]
MRWWHETLPSQVDQGQLRSGVRGTGGSSKASYSGPNGGECVELAGAAGVVAVRDSKDPDGPVLLLTRAALRAAVQSATDTHNSKHRRT